MLTLVLLFFIIALIYSTVGFGGGSSYIAILALFEVSYLMIPKISLLCNILVVTGGAWNYLKSGHLEQQLVFPLVCSSIPFAYFHLLDT